MGWVGGWAGDQAVRRASDHWPSPGAGLSPNRALDRLGLSPGPGLGLDSGPSHRPGSDQAPPDWTSNRAPVQSPGPEFWTRIWTRPGDRAANWGPDQSHDRASGRPQAPDPDRGPWHAASPGPRALQSPDRAPDWALLTGLMATPVAVPMAVFRLWRRCAHIVPYGMLVWHGVPMAVSCLQERCALVCAYGCVRGCSSVLGRYAHSCHALGTDALANGHAYAHA